MRRTMLGVVVGGLLLGAGPGARRALAQDEVSCGLDVGLASKYVWRGLVLTDDPVFEPGFTVEWRGLSVNIWGNMDLGSVNDNAGEFNELDFTLEYAATILEDQLALSAGVLHYRFPNTPYEPTTELCVAASLDAFASPSLKVSIDVDQSKGAYVSFGVGHTLSLPKDMELALGVSFGYGSTNNNEFYYEVSETAFLATDVSLSAALSWELSESVSLDASVAWTALLDEDIRADNIDDDNVAAAATVSWAF